MEEASGKPADGIPELQHNSLREGSGGRVETAKSHLKQH